MVKRVSTYKYLGVHLDSGVMFDEHVNNYNLAKKVSKLLEVLGRVKP